jgi:2-polyprenyl-3-methyl-5-hydroxy-6-metoxy-1,4-benzoquinol methylase
MNVRVDPENNETRALFQLARFDGCDVLEVGCGDGRLTLRYAAKAARVIAIDPFEQSIFRARESLPQELQDTIEFRHTSFADFAASCEYSAFDVVILSWSLC